MMRHWPTHLLIGWLNFACAAPIIYIYIGLPLVMRQHGWSGTEIGLMQLAGLPALLKFLLGTPVDRYRFGAPSYRNWTLLLGLGYALALLAFATHDLADSSRWTIFALALLTNLMGAWTDIPLNALAIQSLPESERLRAGAIRATATSLGAIAGGGLMLLLQTKAGWSWPFVALAASLALGLLLLPLLPAPANTTTPSSSRSDWRACRSYFALPGNKVWSLLLLVYVPVIGAAWIYLKPLLLDHGFPVERIAMLVGIGGGLLAAIASLLGNWLTRRFGVARTLPAFAALGLLALLLLALATQVKSLQALFVVAALATALALGATSGLLFGLMMRRTRPGLDALDYSIQSNLFLLSRTLLPLVAGLLLDHLGYPGLLTALVIAMALVTLLSLRWRQRLHA
ncbi:MFS transporter [Pseudomonas sp. ABC1]|uniref:MFS transporter n=1 Tax=Pseudomonas sp. ABC1 TaxID=2748080 RepID=UPI0015C3E6AC|nr:MFS transporter [Pseudomonas sp. ABC1]QLF91701.1 MFS transporter [Pseudomonas sp. ABC1]